MTVEVMTMDQWHAMAEQLFGKDTKARDWRFVCSNCDHIQSATSMMEHNSELKLEDLESRVFFSCEGRYTPGYGCNWTLGGLFQIHKREVITPDGRHVPVFLFDGEHRTPSQVLEDVFYSVSYDPERRQKALEKAAGRIGEQGWKLVVAQLHILKLDSRKKGHQLRLQNDIRWASARGSVA